MASRSMLGLSERAHTDTVKRLEIPSCTANRRTDKDASPHANDSSKTGMLWLPRGFPMAAE
ncbi:MAG: hypothetical protein L6Q76_13300 [Polyangiaceae bacterium]|nr:hypothetical protein [Polyangiaceae bacterium]